MVKRAAHMEAWYGESSNPFRRARTFIDTGSNTLRDLESQFDPPALRRVSSEPPQDSRPRHESISQWAAHDEAGSPSTLTPSTVFAGFPSEKPEMVGAGTHDLRGEASEAEPRFYRRRQADIGQKTRPGVMARLHQGQRAAASDGTGGSSTTHKSAKRKSYMLGNQLRATLFNSWINVLLVAVPIGITLRFVSVSPVAVFVVNFIAIIPLAAMLSYATEEIALRIGETLGGLLNATFGHVSIAISGRLSNLLLVMLSK
jgi:Ca2+:H+ antiporter